VLHAATSCVDGVHKRRHYIDAATGTRTCRHLGSLREKGCRKGQKKKEKETPRPPVVCSAPDLYCDGWAAQQAPHHTRAVHFVRHPVDMVVSAFQYHSQTPCPEEWQNLKPPHEDISLYDPPRCAPAASRYLPHSYFFRRT
jgi:hypothetical protein